MDYYKVVTQDLKSLGLRKNPNILQFEVGEWIYEKNPIYGKLDIGGIWVTNSRSKACDLKKYMLDKHNKNCRIFRVIVEGVLYSNSYRTKVKAVCLLTEIVN